MVAVGTITHPQAGTLNRPTDGSREQVIDWILTLNPSASRAFLERFEARPLAMYLDHLMAAQSPRGRTARWVRPDETPAIVGGSTRDED